VSRVSEWLETIGLGQYADAFHENHIDIDLLGQLDDQVLKDIGVASAGHRLRIRNAIAKLVAQFVRRRSACAEGDGRRVAADAAARSGPAAQHGPAAGCGPAARSIAIRVRAAGYIAERRGHFLDAENARRRRLRRC
jgi:SAM domain (Sterile alpha motif)